MNYGELTYGEVVKARIDAAIEIYQLEIVGVVTSLDMSPGDYLSNGILSEQFFLRTDIDESVMKYLISITNNTNDKIKEISK
jgi:hypothetical protein